MKLKVTVNSVANDVEYGGEQLLHVAKGEDNFTFELL